jgi:hypothetical protein
MLLLGEFPDGKKALLGSHGAPEVVIHGFHLGQLHDAALPSLATVFSACLPLGRFTSGHHAAYHVLGSIRSIYVCPLPPRYWRMGADAGRPCLRPSSWHA